jgi:hypothetical protein
VTAGIATFVTVSRTEDPPAVDLTLSAADLAVWLVRLAVRSPAALVLLPAALVLAPAALGLLPVDRLPVDRAVRPELRPDVLREVPELPSAAAEEPLPLRLDDLRPELAVRPRVSPRVLPDPDELSAGDELPSEDDFPREEARFEDPR